MTDTDTETATWFIIRPTWTNNTPTAAEAGIQIPDAIREWAADNGWEEDGWDSDLRLVVRDPDDTEFPGGAITWIEHPIGADDLARVRETIEGFGDETARVREVFANS